ncbi:hypothetical protein [Campylobacter sp. JMF_03 NE3]|uniref:hypothetical protein n=1 Tax=Campylobacter sp. JMF_03 NE3 TaxID=2983831 RepID=UPI0022E9D3A8|nr:hypothetical protein [Campylobacter sp. JMF_03 NE3]MDA3053531.1 hypothetical protein [Campylobacter sp. JMF_03 NE3]
MNIKFLILTSCSVLFFTGCGPKIYEENQMYGRGINGGYIFDTMDNDRHLVEKIKRNNADYFRYKLQYGANKLDQILTNKKEYNTKKAVSRKNNVVPSRPVVPQQKTAVQTGDIMLDIAKDRP